MTAVRAPLVADPTATRSPGSGGDDLLAESPTYPPAALRGGCCKTHQRWDGTTRTRRRLRAFWV
jgi:hypothetical protein